MDLVRDFLTIFRRRRRKVCLKNDDPPMNKAETKATSRIGNGWICNKGVRTNEQTNKRTKEATANPRNGWIIGQSRLSCETNAKYIRSTHA